MKKNYNMVDIDGEKLKKVLAQRGIQMAALSREMGYAKTFVKNMITQERARMSVVNYLKAVYNIQPEMYIKKEEPEKTVVINNEDEVMKYIDKRMKEVEEKLDRIIQAFEI
jgi:lambda repressor-like predicted transcriptional regulator